MYRFFATIRARAALPVPGREVALSFFAFATPLFFFISSFLSSSPIGLSLCNYDGKELRGLPIYNCHRRRAGNMKSERGKSLTASLLCFPFRPEPPTFLLSPLTPLSTWNCYPEMQEILRAAGA